MAFNLKLCFFSLEIQEMCQRKVSRVFCQYDSYHFIQAGWGATDSERIDRARIFQQGQHKVQELYQKGEFNTA